VYHGTTLTNAQNILASGVNPLLGRAAADFGQGFYVTTALHQAQQWANQKVRNLQPSVAGVAAVLTFNMDRDLAALIGDHLAFVIADAAFHDFALYNRLGSGTHARSRGVPYDLVYGPVAAFPQTITYANCDQICFLAGAATVRALRALGQALPNPSVGNPLFR
jgi:hypothetical protein